MLSARGRGTRHGVFDALLLAIWKTFAFFFGGGVQVSPKSKNPAPPSPTMMASALTGIDPRSLLRLKRKTDECAYYPA